MLQEIRFFLYKIYLRAKNPTLMDPICVVADDEEQKLETVRNQVEMANLGMEIEIARTIEEAQNLIYDRIVALAFFDYRIEPGTERTGLLLVDCLVETHPNATCFIVTGAPDVRYKQIAKEAIHHGAIPVQYNGSSFGNIFAYYMRELKGGKIASLLEVMKKNA